MISLPPLFDLSNWVGKDFPILLRCVWFKVDTHLSSKDGNNASTQPWASALGYRGYTKGCYAVLVLFCFREGTLFVPDGQNSSIGNNTE